MLGRIRLESASFVALCVGTRERKTVGRIAPTPGPRSTMPALVELRDDQVDTKEHEQPGEAEQDIAQRDSRGTRATLIRFDLGGRDQAYATRQQDREDYRHRDGDDGHGAQGSPVDMHQAALFVLAFLAFLAFLGLRGSSRGSLAYVVGGVAAASTRTSWLSVTLA